VSVQPAGDVTSVIPGDERCQSEDCLYLNIFTPSPHGSGLPVMVFLHGGGFVSGSASSALYAGDALAGEGAVLVTVGYRLGALGWLAHPSLARSGEEAGSWANFGLQDQILALQWVRENAAAFGGDPDNVTIFGESAGAMCVAALLASPLASSLFRRAIIQSGGAVARGVEPAAAIADDYAMEIGLPELSRDALLDLPAEQLLTAQSALTRRYEAASLVFQPVVDEAVLPSHPAAIIASGTRRPVELVIGTNHDEWRLWTWSSASMRQLDERGLERLVRRQFSAAGIGDRLEAREVIDLYRSTVGSALAPSDIYCAIATDWAFRVPSTRLATAHSRAGNRVFSYLFDWESPFAAGALGACHALELPFVFGTMGNPFVSLFTGSGPAVDDLSRRVRRAWVSFAASGRPSCSEIGEWPEYRTSERPSGMRQAMTPERLTMRLGAILEVLAAPMEDERALFDRALGPYGEIEQELAEKIRVPRARTN
jgi:para-nitrobenzyl esterase